MIAYRDTVIASSTATFDEQIAHMRKVASARTIAGTAVISSECRMPSSRLLKAAERLAKLRQTVRKGRPKVPRSLQHSRFSLRNRLFQRSLTQLETSQYLPQLEGPVQQPPQLLVAEVDANVPEKYAHLALPFRLIFRGEYPGDVAMPAQLTANAPEM
jgi:hypothetical protein